APEKSPSNTARPDTGISMSTSQCSGENVQLARAAQRYSASRIFPSSGPISNVSCSKCTMGSKLCRVRSPASTRGVGTRDKGADTTHEPDTLSGTVSCSGGETGKATRSVTLSCTGVELTESTKTV